VASILSAGNNLTYYSFTPRRGNPTAPKRHFRLKKVPFVVAAICVAVIFLQFLYPQGQTLPNARLGETQLGSISLDEAKSKLVSEYGTWARTVKTDGHEYKASASDIGLQIDADSTASKVLDYPWWQRLIPGSFVWRLLNPTAQPLVKIDSEKLNSFTKQVQQENYKPYVNATAVVEGEQVSVKQEQDGQDLPANVTAAVVASDFFKANDALELKPSVLKPVVTKGNAEAAKRDAEKLLSTPPKYVIGDKNGEISKATLGSWLAFTPNEKDKRVDISIADAGVKDFLSGLYPYIYQGQAPGDDSKAVDMNSALSGFQSILDHKGSVVTVTVAQVNVTGDMRANRDYAHSQVGLQALLQNLAREKGDYGIAIRQLDGPEWSASINGDKKYQTASTYKLFVAYAVLKNIEDGVWTWGGSVNGTTVEDCFNAMILYSDNACAEAMGGLIGWSKITNQMHGLGLNNTNLGSDIFTSTASDELIFVTKLGKGEILSQGSRDRLIDVMKRQVYRKGIPAGVGVPVADKVGFLYGLLHDAAIVYSPQGTYALVIMTNGSSWADVADSAARIQRLLQ
jgi:beta-lactamase class A